MTTATMIRVPVRTWQVKAILAAMIGAPLSGLYDERSGTYLAGAAEQLRDSSTTDALIDAYAEERAPIAAIEELLFALRSLTPGPEAVLEVPSEYGLLEKLDGVIDELAGEKVSGYNPHVQVANQRQVAEATIIAIDLRDELVGLMDLRDELLGGGA